MIRPVYLEYPAAEEKRILDAVKKLMKINSLNALYIAPPIEGDLYRDLGDVVTAMEGK